MPKLNNDKKKQSKYNLRNKLKKGKADPESSSDEETIYDTCTDTDSSYLPPSKSKKNNKSKKHVVESDSDDDDDDDDDSDDDSDEDESIDSDAELDERELRKMLSNIFPSKHMNKKVAADKKQTKREMKSKKGYKKSKNNNKNKTKNKNKNKKVESEDDDSDDDDSDDDDSDDDDSDDDADDEDDDDDDEYEENEGAEFKFIITTSGNQGGNNWNEEDEDAINDDEYEECDSEDEKTFMKEKYEPNVEMDQTENNIKIEMLENDDNKTGDTKNEKTGNGKKGKKTKKNDKNNKNDDSNANKSDDSDHITDVEAEYLELVELKKHLSEKLKKKPKSKILQHAVEECRESISKLVKKSRMKNAKHYYKLVNNDQKPQNEIDYFKKKLSNKEQIRIMKQMKEINDHIYVEKPYRLALLDSNIPAKYKATVMQKLNILRSMEQGDPEYYKIKNWVDTFMRVPFSTYKNLSVNINDGIDVCSAFMEKSKLILDDCVYGLNDAKMQILQMVGQWIANPNAMGTAIAIKGPMGTGKCHGINTPILMYDGSIKMVQDIRIGDVVMGDDSTPRNVLGLGRGEDAMYEVLPNKGDTYVVNSEHILCLQQSGKGCIKLVKNVDGSTSYKTIRFNKFSYKLMYKNYDNVEDAVNYLNIFSEDDNIVEISVKDYLRLSNHIKNDWLMGYRAGVEFPHKPVLAPYLLGLWLGDETSITPAQKNLILDVLYENKLIHNNHIPDDYKINDRNTRLQLLAGLLDTCGYYSKQTKCFEITQKSLKLTTDILYLARSLGYAAYQSQCDISTAYKGEQRSNVFYHIHISGTNLEEIPTVHTKLGFFGKNQTKNPLMVDITVRPIGWGKYYGFTLDDNHRYLLGDFTVSHNTTLVKEGISKILGREFAFIALGGTGDASFLEGHSYTYEGSTWGKIMQILIDSKCMNPVIYFDELDKVSDTPRGEEIISILTHLTDTTQNNQFHDKYFSEVDFDLSKCLFIFSYNDESKVNPILKDRMYRIHTKGYDTKEKVTIARNYLLPKIREQVSFKEEDVIIPDETLQYIITNQSLTKGEDGVRNLKRCLEIVHTKLNLFRLMKPDKNLFIKEMDLQVSFPFTVTQKVVDIFIKNEESQNQSLLSMYI